MEKELIARSLAGDEEAFATLFNQHRKQVYHQCLRMVADQEIAEDLTQETFVKAYRHLAEFRKQARFSTWLYTIARREALNFLKKQKQEVLFDETASEGVADTLPMGDAVEKGLSLLTEKQREVFRLFEMEGLSVKEIAAKLGIPSGTVRSRLFYARQRLRNFFNPPPR